MSRSVARRLAMPTSIGDSFMLALAVLLAGYAIAGKTFAYLGVAPLYVGELAFGLGIVAFLQSRCAIATSWRCRASRSDCSWVGCLRTLPISASSASTPCATASSSFMADLPDHDRLLLRNPTGWNT